MRARLSGLVMLALGAGCGTGTEPILEDLPRPLSSAETRLVDAGNQFTFDLFREATRALPSDSNAFLSPLSASMVLGMTLNGARAETFDAVRAALRVGVAAQAEINQGYRDLLQLLLGLDAKTEVQVANSMWARSGFVLLPAFVDAGRTYFGAEIRSLDFASPAAVPTINTWVDQQTKGRIPKLLDQIEPEEVLLLINAIYFKGRWRAPFDPKLTQPAPFTGADGRVRSVPTMSQSAGSLLHAATSDYEAADLLYGNGAFAMTVVLPREGTTPAQVLEGLNPAAWLALSAQFQANQMTVALPKFRLEYTRRMNDDLAALGMGIAFDPTRADLSGIADVAPERLYLTEVLQKTFVEVNEEGTEAAAATKASVGVTSAPPAFVVNRPFLFAIRERLSGTILFIGQINVLP